MSEVKLRFGFILYGFLSIALTACSGNMPTGDMTTAQSPQPAKKEYQPANYASRLPDTISSKGKVVLVDPNVHAWGAYNNGSLVRAGLATAGGNWCSDIGRSCRTKSGTFYIQSLGDSSCKSKIYPVPRGGAPMPYCMYFNGGQGLHGSYEVVEGNISHGCVRMQVGDAEWMRHNFANIGTKVIVKPY